MAREPSIIDLIRLIMEGRPSLRKSTEWTAGTARKAYEKARGMVGRETAIEKYVNPNAGPGRHVPRPVDPGKEIVKRMASPAAKDIAKEIPKKGRFLKRGLAALIPLMIAMRAKEALKERGAMEAMANRPVPSPEELLMGRANMELLAGREARLMRSDPEAYEILQNMLGRDGPELSTGAFMIGPESRGRGDAPDVESLLAALG